MIFFVGSWSLHHDFMVPLYLCVIIYEPYTPTLLRRHDNFPVRVVDTTHHHSHLCRRHDYFLPTTHRMLCRQEENIRFQQFYVSKIASQENRKRDPSLSLNRQDYFVHCRNQNENRQQQHDGIKYRCRRQATE
jgi:hypothetical protein